MTLDASIAARKIFLDTCTPGTQAIHRPIVDPRAVQGCVNPDGLGDAAKFSMGPGLAWGQSTIAYIDPEEFRVVDEGGEGYGGGAEYGIVRTADAAAVNRRMASLHGGAGAVFLPSGLAAVGAVFMTFPQDRGQVVLVPESTYFPTLRLLKKLGLDARPYPSNADGAALESILAALEAEGKKAGVLFLEAPGSHTFDIPDIDALVAIAKRRAIKTAIDNTWGSHVRFRPISHGIDVVIQATTKYEGGYGDTPSGAIIAAAPEDHDALAYTAKVMGMGTVDLPVCRRLLGRIDSAAARMDLQNAAALKIVDWFRRQDFTQEILCPFIETSPDYERFRTYFKKGNGLFTVAFKKTVSAAGVREFLAACPLLFTGQSWGGHVTLALPVHPRRHFTPVPDGEMVRFSVGLEDPGDLLRAFEAAAPALT